MSNIKQYIKRVIKNLSQNLRVATDEIITDLVEAARTISYVETIGNKADTLHRHVKNNSNLDLKRAFEFNTKKAISRMGLGRVVLAVDPTMDLYYGKNGKLNVRQIKEERGASEAFAYVVLSVVEPRPLPLMALPYKQGDDVTALIKELLDYAKSLRITIGHVLFDREFYIGDLISYLSSERIRYLILIPKTYSVKQFIEQTDSLSSFDHIIKYNKYMSNWKAHTKIVIIKDYLVDKKTGRLKECDWCFATNLKHSLYLIFKYKKRWQIETDFRVHDEARIKSKSNEPIVRYFYFMTSLVLMANWEVNRIMSPNVCFKKYLKLVQEKFEQEIT